jgi:hypothetical protein
VTSTLSQSWLRHPQTVWLRRAIFQIHLWTGLSLGLYIVAISISRSALVFRDRIFKAIGNKPHTVAISEPRLADDKLRSLAEKAWPRYRAGYVFRGKQRDQASIVVLDRSGKYRQELFDPYTGQDLGPADPAVLRVLTWLADLHFNLLAGEEGRRWNGYAAILVTLLVLGNPKLASQCRRPFHWKLEAVQLGTAQHDRLLELRLSTDVGSHRNLRRVPGALPASSRLVPHP